MRGRLAGQHGDIMSLRFTCSSVFAAFAALFIFTVGLIGDASAQSSSIQKKTPPREQPPAANRAAQPSAPAQPPAQLRPQVAPSPGEPDEGAGWSTEIEQEAGDQPAPPAGQNAGDGTPAPQRQAAANPNAGNPAALIDRVNDYFNSMTHLQGTFVQVDANDQRTRGRFYVQRPGRIRFDYLAPSALRVVADGRNLSIEDLDLKTVDTYPLDKTPFRMLLAKNVNLVRDARVVGVKEESGQLELTLADRDRGEGGDITLIFDSASSLSLKEWVIDDAQGLKTRIMLSNLTEGKALSADFFQPTPMTFPTLPN